MHFDNLADLFLWKQEGKPWFFNFGTQERYWPCRASYDAIQKALDTMKKQANEESVRSIALPWISAGHGRLCWNKVRPIVEHIFSNWLGTLYVYEEYVSGK